MAPPSAAKIETAIRSIIADLYEADNLADLTVKRVRTAAEQQLGLDKDWFKSHDEWKERSKVFITEEAQRQAESQNEDKLSQKVTAKTNGRSVEPKVAKVTNGQGKKRASEADIASAPSKRRKPETAVPRRSKSSRKIIDSNDEDEEDAEEDQSSSKDDDGFASGDPAQDGSESVESDLSEAPDDTPPPTKRAKASNKVKAQKRKSASPKQTKADKEEDDEPANVGADSESEMSSLIDEEPTKAQKRSKKSDSKEKKSKTTKSSKDADLTPDDLEVRRLKDWLGKCGVRKMWARELASCETPKQKISHLRQMLKDVGMDGRPSLAKANEIRERRELAEELEETQQFNQRWGKAKGDGRVRSAAEAVADLGIEFDDESD